MSDGADFELSKTEAPRPLDMATLQNLMPLAPELKESVRSGLTSIQNADPSFEPQNFIEGARYAFEAVVEAFYNGERETLKDLLSDTLYHSFEQGITAREAAGHKASITIHAITAARIIEAKLNGVMAYVTVDFDVEETITVKDSMGQEVDGSANNRMAVKDIWTFARDVRAEDPNWQVIATRAGENA
jgi:predicted lipid-binding transport protein (Tim44 family)